MIPLRPQRDVYSVGRLNREVRLLLEAGLPWSRGARVFDLQGQAAVPTTLDGLYYGLADREDPARATLLSPRIVASAAFKTSGRVYAWYVLDGPEGCFALRAAPQGGAVVRIDPDAIVEWLRPRLGGDPPHKADLAQYLAHLRSLGLEVHEGPRRGDGAVRFDLVDATTAAERGRELAALRALTPADFAALDGSAYDRVAGRGACSAPHEISGEVVVDLAARTVAAPKVRPGTLWAARVHIRSYVDFHTHPSGRYQGRQAEPPSPSDILLTLHACALDEHAWSFVSAPEGTYVLRPSQALAAAYLHDPQQAGDSAAGLYTRRLQEIVGATLAGAQEAVRALEDAGFVAFLRVAPCAPLLAVPDLFPAWNLKSREAGRAAYAALAALPPAELLAADWAPIVAQGEAPTLYFATWLTAGLDRGGAAVPSGMGHSFGPPDAADSYPSGIPGPLFVVYFPNEKEFPLRVPHAAIAAAQKNSDFWAWAVFLSPTRVTVFRVGADGVELHGPVQWRKARGA